MTLALALVFGGYLAFMLGVALQVARQRPLATALQARPSVAVVVAARDEEACIERCLEAVLAQDYDGPLVVVVADDHSTDGTAEAVHRVAARDGRVRYLRVPDPQGHLRGKAQALHTAIDAVDAEIILITDADCAPVPSWVRTMAAGFADESAGIVCGLARISPRRGRFFDRVQALDWRLLLATVSAAAEAGVPATGMGNNMGVRRAAYRAIGGYPALPFSLAEDFALVRAIADGTDWRVRFPLDPAAVVWTLPADGLAGAYDQRRRWARGGLSGDPWVLPLYGLLFSVQALLVAGLVVAPVAGLAALAARVLGDAAVLWSAGRRVGASTPLVPTLGLAGWMTAYLVTLPFVLVLWPEIGWKGRQHGARRRWNRRREADPSNSL